MFALSRMKSYLILSSAWIICTVIPAFALIFLSNIASFSTDAFVKENHLFLLLLPIAGAITWLLYNRLKVSYDITDEQVTSQSAIPEDTSKNKKAFAERLSIAIFVGTLLTLSFGGSVGCESAAFQIGAAVSSFVICKFLLQYIEVPSNADETKSSYIKRQQRVLSRCGMSAALTALFATPIASTLFIYEMTHKKSRISIHAFWGMLLSSFIALGIRFLIMGRSEHPFATLPDLNLKNIILIALSIIVLCIIGIIWEKLFELVKHQSKKIEYKIRTKLQHRKNTSSLLIIIIGGIIYVAIMFIFSSFNTMSALGSGNELILSGLDGNIDLSNGLLSLFWKIFATAFILSAMFKGGDLTPTIAIGSIAGACVAALFGLPIAFGAGLGIVCVITSSTNCVLASIIFVCESLGFVVMPYMLIAGLFAILTTNKISFYDNKWTQIFSNKNNYLSEETSTK